jgi:peptidyl-tRNA hydrolase, PTH2 family
MALVVNTSLKMSPGKMASQCSHAAVSLYIKVKNEKKLSFFKSIIPSSIDIWSNIGQSKIILKGDNEQHLIDLEKQVENFNSKNQSNKLYSIKIRDAGRTQIERGSLTCLAIFGNIDNVNTITGQLKLLN